MKLKIKELRELRGWSQKELADRMNVSKQLLYKYENRTPQNVSLEVLEKACDAFGCEIGNILVKIKEK